jgi:hypothetical protein
MKPQSIFGIMLLIAAAVLLFVATDASHSIADQFSNLFTGHFTERTTWLFGAGVVSAMLGVFMLFSGTRTRRA